MNVGARRRRERPVAEQRDVDQRVLARARAARTRPAAARRRPGRRPPSSPSPPCDPELRQPVDQQRQPGREQQQADDVQPRARRRARRAGSIRAASASATTPTGRLTKKIQRHEKLSTISPPITGPRIGPSSVGTPITLITRPIRCGPAAWARIACPIGMIMPPPKPCRTRKTISDVVLHASPHSVEPTRNSVDRQHPHALAAEALHRPAGQRDHGRQRQQVARRDPLDRRSATRRGRARASRSRR